VKSGSPALYRAVRIILLPLMRVLFRVSVRGTDLVPTEGPFIVAPSHRSLIDIPFTAYATPSRLRFMAKKELYKSRVLAWLFTSLGGFPVDRGAADRAALRAAQQILDDGQVLAIFPEGTRNGGSEIGPLFDGAAYLAVKNGIPIVPVGIGGSEQILPTGSKFPRLRKVAIVVGKPVYPPETDQRVPRSAIHDVTAALHAELQGAFDDALGVVGS